MQNISLQSLGMRRKQNLDIFLGLKVTQQFINGGTINTSTIVEINRTKEKNVIVGIIYRPPNSKWNEFLSNLDLVLGKISPVFEFSDNDNKVSDCSLKRL